MNTLPRDTKAAEDLSPENKEVCPNCGSQNSSLYQKGNGFFCGTTYGLEEDGVRRVYFPSSLCKALATIDQLKGEITALKAQKYILEEELELQEENYNKVAICHGLLNLENIELKGFLKVLFKEDGVTCGEVAKIREQWNNFRNK